MVFSAVMTKLVQFADYPLVLRGDTETIRDQILKSKIRDMQKKKGQDHATCTIRPSLLESTAQLTGVSYLQVDTESVFGIRE